MSDAYTPTTEEVRDLFDREVGWDGAFDRWLANIEAAAEQRGAARALRDAANLSRACWAANKNLIDPDNPDAAYSFDRWLEVRADRLEGDDA